MLSYFDKFHVCDSANPSGSDSCNYNYDGDNDDGYDDDDDDDDGDDEVKVDENFIGNLLLATSNRD